QFDVIGFSLQYEICYTNVLTILDLGKIALHAADRGPDDTLVIAGGPGGQNPELLAPFVDLFVIGDGEPSLPIVCDLWRDLKGSGLSRADKLARIAGSVSWAYVPRFYEPTYGDDGTIAKIQRLRDDVPGAIRPCVIGDLEGTPLPTRPIVPFVETAHDRIAIEIMRGCPWQCRFCQSTVIKRPLRVRSVETIVQSALESYRNTVMNEISLLSLPSLRVNHQLRSVPKLMQGWRRAGLTLAPEVARDDMRTQIRKPIKNDDLVEGCREAFKAGMSHVKLYFLCGLPGERHVDLDGIVELAERISAVGKEATGR